MVTSQDLLLVLFLIFLEGILSIDNALVLAILARGLPKEQQRKALTYGLVGAFAFRLIALGLVTHLMRWRWVKFVGAAYLIFISVKHFIKKEPEAHDAAISPRKSFWKVVVAIELTDIAFAVDSILAAVALTPKFWIVFTGGVLGIVLMRFAASFFVTLLRRFPAFETSAYLLVFVIGIKLFLEALNRPEFNFHSASSPATWIFWSIMLICVAYGFKPARKGSEKTDSLENSS